MVLECNDLQNWEKDASRLTGLIGSAGRVESSFKFSFERTLVSHGKGRVCADWGGREGGAQ